MRVRLQCVCVHLNFELTMLKSPGTLAGPRLWALDRMPCKGPLAKWMVPPDFMKNSIFHNT